MRTIKILGLLVFLTITSHSFGQNLLSNLFERVHFGVKAGVNYSDFVDADFNTDGLIGFHGGAVVTFDITERLAIEEDFLFSTQGTTLKGDLRDEDIKLSYLSVPVLFQYHTKMGLYLEAGPQFSMLIDDYDGFDTDFAKKIDSGIVGGIGYRFNNDGSTRGLGIGVRYYLGLSKVCDLSSSSFDNTDFKQGVAQASISYVF